ncbi:hypothetical protein [Nocardia thailandica]|uniref:hypothetical protein n=1 Tax=Nocardia thailandica TaxID=257275 RepID=UPI0012F7803D|nr:hypothetical protein [Nocardia thailandica]
MKTRHLITAALAATVLTLTGCSSDEPEKTTAPFVPLSTTAAAPAVSTSVAKTPGVYAPTDTGVSKSTGVEVTILSVEDVVSKYGPVTVFTFQLYNGGDKVMEDYNWPTPKLVYGPPGSPAEQVFSGSEGYGDGMTGALPPGMRQTVKHAFKVTKSELNPAVLTLGSVIWQGDWTAFHR